MTIKSDRNVYVAAHLTAAVKAALEAEAKQQGVSISQYIYMAVLEKLTRAGIDIENYEEL